jgi:undecaprenyl pyrophosphate phosphatase UppP
MNFVQAIAIGLLQQGISELFPVSSLGHTVLIPSCRQWLMNDQPPEVEATISLPWPQRRRR